MNFTLIKIGHSDDEEYPECKRLNDAIPNHFVKTDSFTVLPPLSPQIPGPPPTPNPYRILPPIVSRKRPSFVIIQELGSRPQSRDPSPSGRVSPFRGCGFIPHSRDPSPTRGDDDENEKHQSRSRLPVAKRGQRKVSKSVSPVGTKTSGIPRPLNRRISYSPNRAQEILQEMNANKRNQIKPRPLKSSENLTPTNTMKPANRPQKPPLPQKPSKPKNLNLAKSPDKKITPVTSPNKTLPRPEPKKITSPIKKSPSRPPRPIPKTPEKGKLALAKSKENLAPKLPSPARSPTKISKLPPRSPSRLQVKNEKKPSPKESTTAKQEDKTIKTAVPTGTMEKSPESPSPDEKPSEEIKDKITAMKNNIRRKALTTNIFNATKKLKKPPEKKSPESETQKEEDKKDLPHSDTSRSLPISIGSSNMTESSATLIRTTTEPALAPVEPDLINEIRSAMNEKKSEEICVREDKKELLTNHTSESIPPGEQVVEKKDPIVEKSEQDKIIESITQVESEIEKFISKSEMRNSLPENIEQEVKNSPKLSKESLVKNSPKIDRQPDPRNSPRPVHVVAVTKIEEPKQEITNVGKVKQEADKEVASVNNPISNENRNGMSKSSWLNEKPESTAMKNPSIKKSTKEHTSQEILIEPKQLQSRWNKFKPDCPKCFKKAEKTVKISTITKGGDVQQLPKKSCYKQYFCCFCYKCKLKKGKKEPKAKPEQAKNKKKSVAFRCFNCKHAFRSLLNKISCKKKKKVVDVPKSTKSDSGVACVNVPKKRGFCGGCKSGLFKCLSILCCLNTAFCLKLNSCCKKSCCPKCSCCGGKKKEITETERRKSTISAPRKRRWTRMFTDFPKLDNSFVEHASLMRGAIPVLPVPLAWICLILNVFLPGFGTLSSGIFCLFVGKPRFSQNDSIVSRIGAFLVNLLVAGSQLFTVLFCLVGWGWSIWWGVIMFKMAKKNKRILLAEQAIGTSHATPVLNQNHDAERGLANG